MKEKQSASRQIGYEGVNAYLRKDSTLVVQETAPKSFPAESPQHGRWVELRGILVAPRTAAPGIRRLKNIFARLETDLKPELVIKPFANKYRNEMIIGTLHFDEPVTSRVTDHINISHLEVTDPIFYQHLAKTMLVPASEHYRSDRETIELYRGISVYLYPSVMDAEKAMASVDLPYVPTVLPLNRRRPRQNPLEDHIVIEFPEPKTPPGIQIAEMGQNKQS